MASAAWPRSRSAGRPRTVSFADSLGGQVLLRKERSSSAANPEDRHYFVSGVQIAELTNNGNNDSERIDWNQSVLTHTWTPGSTAAPFRWNTTGGVTGAQMGADGYDPLSPTGQGMSGRISPPTDCHCRPVSGSALPPWAITSGGKCRRPAR